MNNFSIKFSSAAVQETFQAFTWYENVRKGLGEDFKLALDLKIELLIINPHAYSFIYKDIRATRQKTSIQYYLSCD
ncbi:MAG: hypothetical protein M3Z26_16135 [Bacteroidota bacterium]|nr:hypothetical protein [Bacteroidota bacterium]